VSIAREEKEIGAKTSIEGGFSLKRIHQAVQRSFEWEIGVCWRGWDKIFWWGNLRGGFFREDLGLVIDSVELGPELDPLSLLDFLLTYCQPSSCCVASTS
jgi:hypothetical protein